MTEEHSEDRLVSPKANAMPKTGCVRRLLLSLSVKLRPSIT